MMICQCCGARVPFPHAFGSQYVSEGYVNLMVDKEAREYFLMKDGVKQGRWFEVNQLKIGLHSQRLLMDSQNKALAALWQQGHDEWNAYSVGKSEADSEKIFSVSKNGPRVIVSLSQKMSSSVNFDFMIKGNWSNRNCSIYMGHSDSANIIAQMHQSSESINNTELKIYPNVDSAFVVALIAIVDAMNIDEPTVISPLVTMAQEIDETVLMGPQYITNESMNLVFEKVGDDGYVVSKESSSEIIFYLKSGNTTFHRRWMLMDADNAPVAMLQKKHATGHARWYVSCYFGQSDVDPKRVFSLCKNHMILHQTDLNVILENKSGKSTDVAIDYKVKGSWTEKNCKVLTGDSSTKIAQMSTLKNDDKFLVEVYPNVDYAFVTLVVAAVVAMKTPRRLKVVAGRVADLAVKVAGGASIAAASILIEALQ